VKIDERDMVKVTIPDLVKFMNENLEGTVYMKINGEFEKLTLYNSEGWWRDTRIGKWISDGILFRRRNRPFKSMMA